MENLIALVPSIGAGVLFFFVVRSFVRADKNERQALRRIEEEDATRR